VNVASLLEVPDGTEALLFDLDGVIIDTLTLEYDVVNELLPQYGVEATVPREVVRQAFPHPIPESWRRILDGIGQPYDDALIDELTAALEGERTTQPIAVHEGVPELIAAAAAQVKVGVVSNNPLAHIEAMLDDAGVREHVSAVTGNDGEGIRSKPAPDPYLAGARAVEVEPRRCVAIEDSLLGAQSARAAGCFVVGVATGAATFQELTASPDVDAAYARFAAPRVQLKPGDVRRKTLDTPNEFVSHMVEHVAWRLGCEIELRWHSDDWRSLGHAVGTAIAPLLDDDAQTAEALGMIDDGSAEVRVARGPEPHVELVGAGVDVDWFVDLRVEQLANGGPLVELMAGIAATAGVMVDVQVTSLEDPHHTWEAIWRGLGIALRGLSNTLQQQPEIEANTGQPAAGLETIAASADTATVRRSTAETTCEATLTLSNADFDFRIATSDSVNSQGLTEMVEAFAQRAGLGIKIDFQALALSSSHVAAEDVGMTIGAALKLLATERMSATGIEGAGSSLNGQPRPIRVGISFEGRKFLRLVPVGWTYDELRRALIGQTLRNGLFSEDLDDFVDGFAGGMGCSVIIHWEPVTDPDDAWRQIFEGLGTATRQLLQPNRARRGVIAGVKATLA
jgi:HAD superfamily hydrolase (TIGR01509 family)